jgi:hypothetical protein
MMSNVPPVHVTGGGVLDFVQFIIWFMLIYYGNRLLSSNIENRSI